jgi:HNH endonuclease
MSGDCIEWMGSLDGGGYGQFRRQGRLLKAHRHAWEQANGRKITDGLFVLHTCDNRACINPDHLFLGTNQDNMDDMVRKGRSLHRYGSSNPNAKLSSGQRELIAAFKLRHPPRRGRQAGAGNVGTNVFLSRWFGVSVSAIERALARKMTGEAVLCT